ncbi:alpha-ketoglutarate-dependent dioxygenase AlkB [Aurantiacibacter poecillastricola]|uniref:alpha-ketoglutarate-dependent dioxygenase AlkB n=1 Tax=Aurantiacibacter poecillastricola TaxID=3064385 RepID=UPI00273E3521|nr:alpha-ketoglutarate-dependent dioxygenase AlkB [Aurantiacibacter sp. 219JJ12-13]MDP5261225.1 alpha-ketoglutarate-dependent dioxygenase AlkB [Aurantiacibacter sp. 219JJ12-13]
MPSQIDLFADRPALPPIEGLQVVPDAVSPEQEEALAKAIDTAPLEPFRFGQWTGKRLTAYYGSAYDFARGRPVPAPPLPDWLLDLRARLAPLVGLQAEALQQALVIRYDPGAGIGWHRDRPQYGEVLGLSLGAPATLRLRQRRADGSFARHAVPLAPCAAYLLSGEVRERWEHSITPLEETRRSITFRTLL